MAVDLDYLDDLMKSIEPIVYPDGVPNEDGDDVDSEQEVSTDAQEDEAAQDSYEQELANIPEKPSANQPTESEMEVAAALEAVSEPATEEPEEEPAQIEEEAVVEFEEGKEPEWADIHEKQEDIPQEIELDMNMSEEEIDAMLNAARSSADEQPKAVDGGDVTDVLNMLAALYLVEMKQFGKVAKIVNGKIVEPDAPEHASSLFMLMNWKYQFIRHNVWVKMQGNALTLH